MAPEANASLFFASDRMGSMDVYIVSKEGGEPRRLTTHSGERNPVAFSDAGHILFSADIMPSAETVLFPLPTDNSGKYMRCW